MTSECATHSRCARTGQRSCSLPTLVRATFIDAHFAPIHPAYCEKPIPPYDPEGAKALLEEYAAEKGITLPLQGHAGDQE